MSIVPKTKEEHSYDAVKSGASSRDKRATAYLNDVKVLVALAESGNEFAYGAKIWGLQPKVQSLDSEHSYETTKPGILAALRRLERKKVLQSELRETPKKKQKTPHYRIIPTLDTLDKIYKLNGPGVLATVASTAFGRSVIDQELTSYLNKKMELEKDITMIADSQDLFALRVLLGNSGHALIGFLNRTDRDKEKKWSDVEAKGFVNELKDAAFLALLEDLWSNPDRRLIGRDWQISAELRGTVRIEGMTLELESTYEGRGSANDNREGA